MPFEQSHFSWLILCAIKASYPATSTWPSLYIDAVFCIRSTCVPNFEFFFFGAFITNLHKLDVASFVALYCFLIVIPQCACASEVYGSVRVAVTAAQGSTKYK